MKVYFSGCLEKSLLDLVSKKSAQSQFDGGRVKVAELFALDYGIENNKEFLVGVNFRK